MGDIGLVDTVDVEDGYNGSELVLYYRYDHPRWKEEDEKVVVVVENRSAHNHPPWNTTGETHPDIYQLNWIKSRSYLPIFIILGLIVAIGVLGNVLVCYIYRCRARRATSNFFVIFFAIFDMFGCFVGIPLEMSALALPYIYDVVPLCKIMGFIETVSVCGLCLTLICVVYDCYRKLCRPNEDYGVKNAKKYCLISVILTVLISIPAPAVFGMRKTRTPFPGVYGWNCAIDLDMPRWLRIMYYVCVLATFAASLSVVSVLFCLIAVHWWRQRQAEERGEKPSPAKREFPKKHRFVREDTSSSSVTNFSDGTLRLHSPGHMSPSAGHYSDPARVPLKTSSGAIVKTNSLQASSAPASVAVVQLHVKHTRQTWMFLVISIVFVVSMLPFVVVTVLCMATNVFNNFSSDTTEIVFNLCIRSYLLNYMVKPIVYVIFNLNFRKEVKFFFIKVWMACTHSTIEQQNTSRPLRRSFTMGASRSTSRTPIYKSPINSA